MQIVDMNKTTYGCLVCLFRISLIAACVVWGFQQLLSTKLDFFLLFFLVENEK